MDQQSEMPSLLSQWFKLRRIIKINIVINSHSMSFMELLFFSLAFFTLYMQLLGLYTCLNEAATDVKETHQVTQNLSVVKVTFIHRRTNEDSSPRIGVNEIIWGYLLFFKRMGIF